MTFANLKIHFTNSLSRQKEDFVPIDPTNVRLYNCGVTPYDYAHIGNARNAVAFDVLFRFLREVYGAEHVTYVRNFTDVDDKIIARANERGTDTTSLSQEFMQAYTEDVMALGCLKPTHEPLVTEVMDDIITFIQKLIDNGSAYVTDSGDVNFDISTKADYGKLSGKKLEELQAGARVEVDTTKRNAGDFALWKAAKAGEPFWKSPWSNGRPGWHIECSVMSEKLLGTHFDIHSGGEDLQFPHHENEIAQSECSCGHQHVNYWLHNAFITVDGKRMGKSMGNFTTIREALKIASGAGIRLWLLTTHYRKPVDFSTDAIQAAEKRVKKYLRALENAPAGGEIQQEKVEKLLGFLADDLNTSRALSVLDELRKPAGEGDANAAPTLRKCLDVLGLV